MSWNLQNYGGGMFTLTHFVLDEIFGTWQYKVNIFLTKDQESTNRWVEFHILQQKEVRLIGFDTEAQCGHKKGQKPVTCLLQFCVENNSSLFILLYHCPQNNVLPSKLKKVLQNPKYFKCGVGINGLGGDARDLIRQYGVNMQGGIDLFDITQEGLKKSMSEICRNMEVPTYKSICTSSWGSKNLDKRQIMYSTLDAVYGLCLAKHHEKKGVVLKNDEDAKSMIERLEAEKKARETAKRRNARIRKKLKRDKSAALLEILRQESYTDVSDKQLNHIIKITMLYTAIEERELKAASENRDVND